MTIPTTPAAVMLWESVDPNEALRERFGFADPAAAGRWVTDTLVTQYRVSAPICERIVMSDHNAIAWAVTPTERLLLKWSVARDRFPRLAALADLTCWLEAHGQPVSAPIPSQDGSGQLELDGVSMSLQREVQGHLLDVDDPTQVRTAGAALARLHGALAAYPLTVLGLAARSRTLADQIGSWLATCPSPGCRTRPIRSPARHPLP